MASKPQRRASVTLERLWAGWRSAFVTTRQPEGSGCVFCDILASGLPDDQTHILWRGEGVAFAVLNLYPYTSGHMMVMPTRHVGEVEALTSEESSSLWGGLTGAVQALKTAYHPDALNLGANVGRAAGAGVPGHFHIHVLPRWDGDTNFMTTVADTRVLPEAMTDTAKRLRAAWPAPSAAP